MKKILFLLLSIATFSVFAQSKPPVKILGAYFTERIPGNVPVDENGKPMMRKGRTYTLYVETGNEKITWGKAWYNNQPFTVIVTKISNTPHHAGEEKQTGKKLYIKPSKGNTLYSLELVPFEKSLTAPDVKQGSVLLQVKYGSKSLRLVTDKLTELVAEPAI